MPDLINLDALDRGKIIESSSILMTCTTFSRERLLGELTMELGTLAGGAERMSETVGEGAFGARKLILGFDAGCFACSDLAKRIKEQVGDKLEIHSLREPQVEHWRKEAFGEGAPWAPTLFEIQGTKVKAWTSWKMGIHLSRFLGPVDTWRVMQTLGEVGADTEGSLASGSFASLTRGQFLKGVGGAMVAMSVLSSTDVLSGRASAEGWVHPLERVRFESREQLRGEAKRKALRAALGSQDVQNVWSDRSSSPSGVYAVRHTLEGGNSLTAVSWSATEGKVVVYYVAARPIGNYRSQAMLLTAVPGKEVVKAAESVNGEQRTLVVSTSTSQAQGVRLARCGCCRWRWGCVATVASSCVGCAATCATCVATPAKWVCGACLSCALVGCPLGIRRCCRRRCG
jgi:hypothetical protein